MESYLGSIFAFGFNFAPVGWELCNGQLLPISQNEALYTLIGTTYGGDGITTFGVPDLRGRVPVGTGQGPGLSNYVLGQLAGTEATTLTVSNLPPHTHPVLSANVPVSARSGDSNDPAGNYLGVADDTVGATYISTPVSSVSTAPSNDQSTSSGGGNQPVDILNPYQVVNYCICTSGVFPPQS